MSMQRLLLRTAMVGALKNVTIAQNRVYDTRLGAIEQSKLQDYLPAICVYTDNDKREQLQTGDGNPLFKRTIDLQLEISVGSWREVEIEGPQGNPEMAVAFSLLETDAELEAMLDLLELQIWHAIWRPEPAAWSLQKLIKQVTNIASTPGRSTEGNNRLSARGMVLTCEIKDDCLLPFDGTQIPNGLYPPIEKMAPHLVEFLAKVAATPGLETLRNLLQAVYGKKPLPEPDRLLRFGIVWGHPPETINVTEDLS